jgi:MarR family transcriptional regulator, lower aerobic nicotinate degradation pathway regulator
MAHFAYIERQHQRNASRVLEPFGLKHRDWRVLMMIDQAGTVSVTTLAEVAVVERSTIGKLLTRLKGKGLVADATPTRDARVNPVRLTAGGRALLNKTTPRIVDLFERYRGNMTKADHASLMRLTAQYRQGVFEITETTP